jgi:hypothetical protein
VERGPGEDSVARAFLSHASRDAVAALDGVSEPEIEVLLEDLRELPVVYPSMRVELPTRIAPALERLTDTYAVGDLALHKEGQLGEHAAAAAALELGTRGSRELLRECMTEAIAAWVSDAYVRRGLLAGPSASAREGEPGQLNLVDR